MAENAPHYLYWSPDSRTLAVLASTPQGLTLFAADTESLTEPTVIESGAPLYFNWGADGQSMLVHVGDELKLLTRPFGASSGQQFKFVARWEKTGGFSGGGNRWTARNICPSYRCGDGCGHYGISERSPRIGG